MGRALNVLIGCESSGTMREAFRALGHNAWSLDLLPADDNSPYHFQRDLLAFMQEGWGLRLDIIILHPPCTRLSASGQWYVKRHPEAQAEQQPALRFVEDVWRLAKLRSKFVALENPIGVIPRLTTLGPATQIVQPHQFGDDASKATCLWLNELPCLTPTKHVPPRIVDGKKRWANQTDSGQNKTAPSDDRWKLRSKTFDGIAKAAAEQWSSFVLNATH